MAELDAWLATWNTLPSVYLIVALVVGLIVGSFLNVVIYRLPKMLEQAFRNDCCDFLGQEKSKEKTISESGIGIGDYGNGHIYPYLRSLFSYN